MEQRIIEYFETADGKRHYLKDFYPDRIDELREIMLNNGLVLHDDGQITVRKNDA